MLRVDPANLCPRLIDYLLIVGSRSPKRNQISQTPELLRCYPIHVHSDFNLPPDVVYFCQPEGCITTTRRHLKTMPNGEESFFVFTLTDKDSGKVRYGACLNFYRLIEREPKSPKRSPKHTVGLAKRSGSSANNSSVADVSQRSGTVTDSESECEAKTIASKSRKSDGKRQSEAVSKKPETACDSSSNGTPKRRVRIATHTLTSLCIVSHHSFFSAFRDVLTRLRRFIEARQARCVSELGQAARQSASVWRTLTAMMPNGATGAGVGEVGAAQAAPHAIVLHDVREIETWIFRLLSAPVPVPGMTRLELYADPADAERSMQLAYPDNTRLPLVDLPLHLPLELLGVDLYCRLLSCIMLEQKVAIQSRDFGALTMTVLALVASLYPLEYMFTVIPLLPTCMSSAEQLLLVPTPFLIGIPTSFLLYKHQFQLPGDIWLVDLDSRKMFVGSQIELPALPAPDGTTLRQQMASVLARLGVNERGTDSRSEMHVPQSDGRSHQHVHVAHACTRKSHTDTLPDADPEEADVALRAALVRFLGSPNVLGNFAEHTRTLRLYPRPVVAFQCAAFVKSRPRGPSAFTNALARTQAVEYFAEWQLTRADAAQPFVRIAANPTSACDAPLVGDKPRWFASQLHPLTFRVSRPQSGASAANASASSLTSACTLANTMTSESGSENEESGEAPVDMDRQPSSASSFSSLCSFVNELIGAQIGTEVLDDIVSSANAVVNPDGVCTPPTALHLPGASEPDLESLSQKTVDRPHSSSPPQLSSDDEEQPRAASSASSFLPHSATATTTLRPEPSATSSGSAGPPSPLQNGSRPSSSSLSLAGSTSKPGSTSNVSNTSNVSVSASQTGSGTPTKRLAPTEDSSKQLLAARPTMSIRQRKQNFSLQLANQNVSGASTHNSSNGTSSSSWLPFGLNLGALAPASSTNALLAVGENQQYLKEVVSAVLEGQGVGLLKSNRIRKLMENENYRNFVLSRLNLGMDKRVTDPDDHLEDNVTTLPVLKGMLQLARLILTGLETSYYSAGGSSGGVASAFLMLEIAHTHYALRGDAAASASTPVSVTPTADYPTSTSASMSALASPLSGAAVSGRSSAGSHSHAATASHSPVSVTANLLTANRSLTPPSSNHQPDLNNLVATFTGWWSSTVSNLRSPVTPLSGSSRSAALSTNLSPADASARSSLSDAPTHITLQQRASLPAAVSHSTRSQSQLPILAANAQRPQGSAQMQGLSAVAVNGDEFENVDLNNTTKAAAATTAPGSSVKVRKSDSSHGDAERVPHSPVRDADTASLRTAEPSVHVYPAKSRSSGAYRYLHNRLVPTYRSPTVANRVYLFEMMVKERSRLFDDVQFWEDMFLDAVAQERDVVGMDQAPTDLLERYSELSVTERKRLELDEDRLLCALMCNTIAFMTLMRVGLTDMRRKMRRLLGKCHIGLHYSAMINDLLDQLEKLQANDIDLKPPASRLMQKQSFTVHLGTDNSGDMAFLEVCDDCLILRSISGIICDRWWFEKLVNMTFCPRTKVIRLWRKLDGQMQDRQFYTKRCQELYSCVKDTMQRAAQRTGVQFPAIDLGGEFPVQSVTSGETGTIQVRLDGVTVQCGTQSLYVQLHRVKRCATENADVFLIEFADASSNQVECRRYRSVATSHIVTSLHRVFSYQSAKLQLLRGVASAYVHPGAGFDSQTSSGSSRQSPASSAAATPPCPTD